MSSVRPPHSTDCSPKRSVSVSSLNVVASTAARVPDVALGDPGARLVGHAHHDDVGLAGGGGGVDHAEAGRLGLLPRRAVGAEADADVHPAVAQVERVRVALTAVAEDGDLLALERRERRVAVVVDVHEAARSFSSPSAARVRVPRNIATLPVRTISLMPIGFSSSISAWILSSVPVTSMT